MKGILALVIGIGILIIFGYLSIAKGNKVAIGALANGWGSIMTYYFQKKTEKGGE